MPFAFIMIALGLAYVVMSLPLILRLIPMNRFYGFRTPQAFRSPEAWYTINAYGGRLLIRIAPVQVGVGVLGLLLPGVGEFAYVIVAAAITLFLLGWTMRRIVHFGGTQ